MGVTPEGQLCAPAPLLLITNLHFRPWRSAPNLVSWKDMKRVFKSYLPFTYHLVIKTRIPLNQDGAARHCGAPLLLRTSAAAYAQRDCLAITLTQRGYSPTRWGVSPLRHLRFQLNFRSIIHLLRI